MLEQRPRAARAEPVPKDVERFGQVAIGPIEPRTRVVLRLRPAEAARRGAVAGLALDGAINTATWTGDRRALRLGPDEWLIVGHDDEAEELFAGLAADLTGVVHASVDVSHRQAGFVVSGAGAADVLNAGCPLDLSLAAFPPGAVTRSVLGKVEIMLTRVDETTFEVETWRSFAAYLRTFLVHAARDA